jgi:hypothetical protein
MGAQVFVVDDLNMPAMNGAAMIAVLSKPLVHSELKKLLAPDWTSWKIS